MQKTFTPRLPFPVSCVDMERRDPGWGSGDDPRFTVGRSTWRTLVFVSTESERNNKRPSQEINLPSAPAALRVSTQHKPAVVGSCWWLDWAESRSSEFQVYELHTYGFDRR